jgi:hypothetical protein
MSAIRGLGSNEVAVRKKGFVVSIKEVASRFVVNIRFS